MRQVTKTFTYYKFDELSAMAQDYAIASLYDLNLTDDWWDATEEDAKMIGCELTEFDIDRGSYCKMKLGYETDVIDAILRNHGPDCETFKLAKEYQNKILDEDGNIDSDAAQDFKHDLQECYLSMLRLEFEYMTSEESIIESIKANDYEFNEKGEIQ